RRLGGPLRPPARLRHVLPAAHGDADLSADPHAGARVRDRVRGARAVLGGDGHGVGSRALRAPRRDARRLVDDPVPPTGISLQPAIVPQFFAIQSEVRSVCACSVNVGGTPPIVGNSPPPVMNRLPTSCVLPWPSVTESFAVLPITVPPRKCARPGAGELQVSFARVAFMMRSPSDLMWLNSAIELASRLWTTRASGKPCSSLRSASTTRFS